MVELQLHKKFENDTKTFEGVLTCDINGAPLRVEFRIVFNDAELDELDVDTIYNNEIDLVSIPKIYEAITTAIVQEFQHHINNDLEIDENVFASKVCIQFMQTFEQFKLDLWTELLNYADEQLMYGNKKFAFVLQLAAQEIMDNRGIVR